MTVYCIHVLGCVMFDASMATCMNGWFEIEFEYETISLAILNNFLTAIFIYFIGLERIL